ncbi:hypothetical protein [Cellvibrio sp. UBA7671]|uniref:hypothetical protein n=1 Tax=Cellvibrio sp. UBA7671 TaxID=1946312 RepID=UPI002F358A82
MRLQSQERHRSYIPQEQIKEGSILEEVSFFTPHYIFNILMNLITAIVNFYAYISLKKMFSVKNEIYISYLSKAFLFFGISTLLGLFSFVTIILLAGAVGESPYFDIYVDVPYNLAFVAGLFYVVIGIRNTKLLKVG